MLYIKIVHFCPDIDMLFPKGLTSLQVMESINAVVTEWFRLGLKLGVPPNTMETIQYDHCNDVEACKIKVVQQWLKQPHPLWCSLVEALNEIGLKKIAAKISDNYSTSKFILHAICLLLWCIPTTQYTDVIKYSYEIVCFFGLFLCRNRS